MAFQKKRAPFDKVIKYVVEQIQSAVAPLEDVVKNQQIIIAQNKQIIDLLDQIRDGRKLPADIEQPHPTFETNPAQE